MMIKWSPDSVHRAGLDLPAGNACPYLRLSGEGGRAQGRSLCRQPLPIWAERVLGTTAQGGAHTWGHGAGGSQGDGQVQ